MRIPIVLSLLVSAAIASAQESRNSAPRQMFERAAFAEEHERDFQKAAALYREAGNVAQFLGDQALADEAMKALQRVEARMGKGAESAPSPNLPPAVQRRLFLLVKQLGMPKEGDSEQKNYEAKSQLVAFGAVAVPILEKALNAETITDPGDEELAEQIRKMRAIYTENWPKLQAALIQQQQIAPAFRGDSRWAARTLLEIDHPDAMRALERGLDSPDPVVRTAVLQGDPIKYRKLFDRALKDSSPAVARAAIWGLTKVDDPALLDVMRKALTGDDDAEFAAAEWLVRVRPDVALDALKGSVPSSPRGSKAIVDFWFNERFKIENGVARMVEAAEANPDANRALELLASVQHARGGRFEVPEPLRQRIEAFALRILGDGEPQGDNHWNVLNWFGRLPTLEALAKLFDRGSVPPERQKFLATWMADILRQIEPADFSRALAVVRTVAARKPEQAPALFSALGQMAGKKFDSEQVIAGLATVESEQRLHYISQVILEPGNASTAALIKGLEIGNEDQRGKAVNWLAVKSDPAALPAIVAALRDPAVKVRLQAREPFRRLALHNQKQATALLEAALKAHASDPTDDEIVVIGFLPPKNAVELIDALWISAPEKKSILIDVARSIAGEEASAFLVKNFDAIENPELKGRVIARFGAELYAPAIEVIGPILSSRDPGLRETARTTLEAYRKHREALEEFERWKTGGAESRASIAELIALLESGNRDVVVGAVRALAAVKAKSALPALVKLIERNDSEITKAVEEAIKKMGE